ncbi:hypothetical protein BVG16_11680 [Paenibacillus selenitireducens]|uniref:DUF3055 domain-containing protein n=1 Tax=Paenibacillus selenitireducens TaxID=1324314 RepID=A0A1T2XFX6_9BACL|nr:DUF3055 domain-containing protein [Paenibacillus selenitireducens]OPA78523.1 hypothetical protein BVG16_11680 [Paenibacillus selenitireducens]
MFEHLYDEAEQANVNFIGCISERARYDFSIIYSKHFFGKPLVVCMQTGRSGVVGVEDLDNVDYIQNMFHITDSKIGEDLAALLKLRISGVGMTDQY